MSTSIKNENIYKIGIYLKIFFIDYSICFLTEFLEQNDSFGVAISVPCRTNVFTKIFWFHRVNVQIIAAFEHGGWKLNRIMSANKISDEASKGL